MDPSLDRQLLVIFHNVHNLLRPFTTFESLIPRAVGITPATPFRLVPVFDPHAGYPACEANTLALILVLLIPWMVTAEWSPGFFLPVGWMFRPITCRCSGPVAWLIMFARVWLFMALVNSYVMLLLINPY